jgi:nucleotide-binding universal stress UspA family protein
VLPAADLSLPIQLGLGDQGESDGRLEARRRLDELQRTVGCQAPVRIAVGPVKEALLEEARRSDADVLVIGRSAQSDARGRMRDPTYTVVRDSPYPVASV